MTNKAIDHQQTVCQYCFHAEFNLFSSVNCYFKPNFITLKFNSICQYKDRFHWQPEDVRNLR